jgi:hypothetical protein
MNKGGGQLSKAIKRNFKVICFSGLWNWWEVALWDSAVCFVGYRFVGISPEGFRNSWCSRGKLFNIAQLKTLPLSHQTLLNTKNWTLKNTRNNIRWLHSSNCPLSTIILLEQHCGFFFSSLLSSTRFPPQNSFNRNKKDGTQKRPWLLHFTPSPLFFIESEREQKFVFYHCYVID